MSTMPEQRGPGRPAIGQKIPGFAVYPDELAAVHARMARDGCTKAEAIRRLIRDGAGLTKGSTMTRAILDVHVVQTLPPSVLNRDDTGAPKAGEFGGTHRARVSSQAWKRAIRTALADAYDPGELAVRTKQVIEVVGQAIVNLDPGLDGQQHDLASELFRAAGIKTAPPKHKTPGQLDEAATLLFVSRRQVAALARLAADAAATGKPPDRKDVWTALNDGHSPDIALFGRMVTVAGDDTGALNVDAAAQVAHALSVHPRQREVDFWTAVDDAGGTSAAMIGEVELNAAATFYRYATVDVGRLQDNLGGDDAGALRALRAFLRAFVTTVPSARQARYAHGTLPDAVLVVLRDTQPINLVTAYTDAIESTGGYVTAAIEHLAREVAWVHAAYAERPLGAWVVGSAERVAPLTEVATHVDLATMTDAVDGALAVQVG